MFIADESKHKRSKPHRGGMVVVGVGHAAPTELERIIGSTVTINMSLLRSWPWAGSCRNPAPEPPNPASTVDRGMTSLANSGRPRPAATDSHRLAGETREKGVAERTPSG
jgi:hypothetical protein